MVIADNEVLLEPGGRKADYAAMAAERFIRVYGDRLLIVRDAQAEKVTLRPLLLDGRGVWFSDEAEFVRWFDSVHLRLDRSLRAAPVTGAPVSYVKSMLGEGVYSALKRLPSYATVGRGLEWRGVGDVEVCEEHELDADGRYLVCANGVLDLAEGRLLSLEAARTKRVTGADAAVAFNPARLLEGEPFGITALRETWGSDWLEFALDWCARALWGAPDKSFLLIVGPRDSGKGALFAMLAAALGGANVQMISADALKSAGSDSRRQRNNEEIAPFARARIVFAADVAGRAVGTAMKQMTGGAGTRFPLRLKRGAQRMVSLRAQILLTAVAAPHFGASEKGVQSRMRVIRHTTELDPRVKASLSEPESAEWVLATLAARARRLRPPDDLPIPKFIHEASEKQRLRERDPLERFVEARLEKVEPDDRHGVAEKITVAEAWKGFAAFVDEPAGDFVLGMGKAHFSRTVTRLLRAEAVRVINIHGMKARGWINVRWRVAVDKS